MRRCNISAPFRCGRAACRQRFHFWCGAAHLTYVTPSPRLTG